MATWCVWLVAFSLVSTHVATTEGRRQSAVSSPSTPCPDQCECVVRASSLAVRCTTLKFTRSLPANVSAKITTLDVSHASIRTLDKGLWKFVNLNHLNLSHNNISDLSHFPHLSKLTHLNLRSNVIKSFSAKYLSSSIEYLDLSQNYIRELPQDLLNLQFLKRLYIAGNPFTCSPASLGIRDGLLERKVKVIGNVRCHDPNEFKRQSWHHAVDFDAYFKIHNQDDMQNDEGEGSGAVEGSGDVFNWTDDTSDVGKEHLTSTKETAEKDPYQKNWSIVEVELSTDGPDTDDDLGSGDWEDLGAPKIPVENDTDDFIFTKERSGASLEPDPYLKISSSGTPDADDGLGSGDSEVLGAPKIPVKETIIVTTKAYDLMATNSDTGINEIYSGESKINKSQSMGTNIFLGVFLLCLVALLIYALKKNKDRKRQSVTEEQPDLENNTVNIELLPKEKMLTDKQNGKPESVPLLEQQNGGGTPAAEPQANGGADGVQVVQDDVKGSPVQMRSKSAVGSKELEGVTVKMTDLPEPLLQTPVLVTRSKSSDGTHFVITHNANNPSGGSN